MSEVRGVEGKLTFTPVMVLYSARVINAIQEYRGETDKPQNPFVRGSVSRSGHTWDVGEVISWRSFRTKCREFR